MAKDMFGDIVEPSIKVGSKKWYTVPVSIIAHDPATLGRIADWGWVDGMRPDSTAPVWLMSAFRNRFLDAFGS